MTGIEPALIGAIAAGTSAAVGAASAIAQGRAAADAAEFNAEVAERDAVAAKQAAAFDEQRIRDRNKRVIASQKASFGASGVTAEGSPLEVLGESAEDAEIDALAIRYSGSIQESRARSRAASERANARAARTAGIFKAGTSLLTGVSGVVESGVFDE